MVSGYELTPSLLRTKESGAGWNEQQQLVMLFAHRRAY